MKSTRAITFTLTENLETGEMIVSPGVVSDHFAFETDDNLIDNAWANDDLEYLSYHYTAYMILFDTENGEDTDAVPASDEMVRAFQTRIDDNDLAILDLADFVAEGCYTVHNPYWEEEHYTPSCM